MCAISRAKTKLILALIEFNDQCKASGQDGLISTGIAEAMKETTPQKTIELICKKLQP